MYKLHLILKYLRKRRIAWVSLAAVMLCTAMVIVVISVMGGWLAMFRESFHGISGDIVVTRQSLTGFPYYQEMIEQIEQFPQIRDRAIFVGNPEDIVPDTFGADLPSIRAWTEQHTRARLVCSNGLETASLFVD